ncbi:MAG: Hsp20/alpha crystallin family protein [Campylobacterota bacterium]|nr:Hsp20/alpha crystallin family protein [Campylobacterota bacterium]
MNKLNKTVLALSLVTTLVNAQTIMFHPDINDEFNKMQNFITGVVNSDFKNQYFQKNYPQMNIQDKDNSYIITFNLAGMEKKDIKLSLEDNNMLTIEGEKREENNTNTHSFIKKEIHMGKFKRSILLPDDINIQTLKTEYNNGILKINIKKRASQKSSSKVIPIN